MVRVPGSESDAGAIREPEPSTGRLLLGDFQSFLSPDPLDPFVIDPPPIVPQESRHLSIAIPSILARQLDDGRRQRRFIIRRLTQIALRGPRLAQHATDAAFREAQRRAAVVHCLPSARWA